MRHLSDSTIETLKKIGNKEGAEFRGDCYDVEADATSHMVTFYLTDEEDEDFRISMSFKDIMRKYNINLFN